MHGRVQAAVRSVCYSSVLGERPGFERASCSCSEACSCLAAEVSSVGAGSGWVFFSGARVIAPTILSRFESLRALLVVWSLALSLCRNRRRRESVRAVRGCAVQWRAHAARWALPCAKGRAEGVVRASAPEWCWALRGKSTLPRKVGKFQGK